MHGFPAPETIPVAAPLWLLKILHVALLALHFVTVQLMLGGLLLVVVYGRRAAAGGPKAELAQAAATRLSRILPVLMTYLINLGVPPLLFAQLLYGHFLYTSSVVIGAWWLGVMALLMTMYALLYVASGRAVSGKSPWGPALGALLLGGLIALIYSTNMTLMLRPDRWTALYRANAHGTHLALGDPTLLPRWLYMLTGGLTVAGMTAVVLSASSKSVAGLRELLLVEGGTVASIGAVLQLLIGLWVSCAQPAAVSALLSANYVYLGAGLLWGVLLVVVLAVAQLAVKAGKGANAPAWLPWAAFLAPVLLNIMSTAYRDGIRDLTLKAAGFNVWETPYLLNIGVLLIFLVLVVLALAIVGVLIKVSLGAKPEEELAR